MTKPDKPPGTLGSCCLCEQDHATVLLFLTARSLIPHHGWGCAQCQLPSEGAIAVLCAACAAQYEHPDAPHIELYLRFACRGYPGSEGRIPFSALRGEWQHIRHRHPELGDCPPLTVLPTDTLWSVHMEEGERGCWCSRCHQTIHEGTVAIRAWPKNSDGEYRYHGSCFGADPSPWDSPYEEEET